ncbi:MAG: diguanylate cyclase [Planctomycetota bacterium]
MDEQTMVTTPVRAAEKPPAEYLVQIEGPALADCEEVERCLTARYALGDRSVWGEVTLRCVLKAPGTPAAATNGAGDLQIQILAAPASPDLNGKSMPPGQLPRLCLVPASLSSDAERLRQAAFRHGAHDVLVAPYTNSELRSRVDRLLLSRQRSPGEALSEQNLLGFLKSLQDHGLTAVAPVFDPSSSLGYVYPDVVRYTGRYGAEEEILEHLAGQGLLSPKLAQRLRVCPDCGRHNLVFTEVCPGCGSLDFSHHEVLHHFACAHVNSVAAFQKGDKLVCPKCQKELRHIGLEYEKPASYYRCESCKAISPSPKVQGRCLACGHVCDPGQTREKLIYQYTVTPLAAQAVQCGQVSGVDLAAVLRAKNTGLLTRQYFLYELERELARAQRYKTSCALLLVRLKDYQHIRFEHADQAQYYLNTVFQTLSKSLRTLDCVCVWDTDTLAVLLPDTGAPGAKIVAQRMHKDVQGLELLYDIHKPDIAVSLVASEGAGGSPEKLISAALQDLGTPK